MVERVNTLLLPLASVPAWEKPSIGLAVLAGAGNSVPSRQQAWCTLGACPPGVPPGLTAWHLLPSGCASILGDLRPKTQVRDALELLLSRRQRGEPKGLNCFRLLESI